MFKPIITVLLFIVLALIQGSFFTHLGVNGLMPSLVFILFFSTVFFQEKHQLYQGIVWVFLAGALEDALSIHRFGIFIGCYLLAYSFIRITLYFLREHTENSLLYFVPLFIISFLLYQTLLSYLSQGQWLEHIAFMLFYNLIFALIAFFIYPRHISKQLKLGI